MEQMLIKKIVDVNITKFVKTPKLPKELPHYLSLQEAEDILNLPVGSNEKAFRERLILELFYSTGVRISELIAIRMNDIRLEEGVIYIMGKGNKERLVMIGGETLETLRQLEQDKELMAKFEQTDYFNDLSKRLAKYRDLHGK